MKYSIYEKFPEVKYLCPATYWKVKNIKFLPKQTYK